MITLILVVCYYEINPSSTGISVCTRWSSILPDINLQKKIYTNISISSSSLNNHLFVRYPIRKLLDLKSKKVCCDTHRDEDQWVSCCHENIVLSMICGDSVFILVALIGWRWRLGGDLEWVCLPTHGPHSELGWSFPFVSLCPWDLFSSHTPTLPLEPWRKAKSLSLRLSPPLLSFLTLIMSRLLAQWTGRCYYAKKGKILYI